MVRILEQFTMGKKGDPALNEDKIVLAPHFTVVLDGVTSSKAASINGMSSGRFAVETLAVMIAQMRADITAREAVDEMTTGLRTAICNALQGDEKQFAHQTEWPGSAMVLYSHKRREIWRVADCNFKMDKRLYKGDFKLDEVWIKARQAAIEAAIASGATLEQMKQNDPGCAVLEQLMTDALPFANYAGEDTAYGYGVLNAHPVPDKFVEVFAVPEGVREVIFTTDGYPADTIGETLVETEENLQRALRDDPMMWRIYPQPKAYMPGLVSYDDRAFLRFQI